MNPPTAHPGDLRLADYRAGRLTAPETLAVSDHLADCPSCRAALASGDPDAGGSLVPGALLPTTTPDAPPDYDEMCALLDNTLDVTQRADAHARLAASPQAAAEFADLQRFRDDSAALPPRLHGSAIDPEPGKIVAFPRWVRASLAVAAALVLCLAGWWITSHRSSSNPPLWADADLSGLPDALRREVEQAARTGIVAAPAFAETLRPSAGTLAGAPPPPTVFRQIGPVGVVVREDRPALRWTAREGATAYIVYLTDLEGRTPMLRQEVPGDRTVWTPPAPLARGAVYEWQVEGRRGGEIIDRAPRPPAPETRFQVLGEARAAELARVENRFPQNALILGTAYTQAGLDAAAVGQFAVLRERYPRSAAAKRLWQEARARSSREE